MAAGCRLGTRRSPTGSSSSDASKRRASLASRTGRPSSRCACPGSRTTGGSRSTSPSRFRPCRASRRRYSSSSYLSADLPARFGSAPSYTNEKLRSGWSGLDPVKARLRFRSSRSPQTRSDVVAKFASRVPSAVTSKQMRLPWSRAADEKVVPTQPRQPVVSGSAVDDVRLRRSLEHVVLRRPDDPARASCPDAGRASESDGHP